MPSYLRYLLIATALLAGAFFAACSSDSDDGDPDAEEPNAEQPVDSDDTSDTADDNDVSDDLSSFANRFGGAEVKVEYEFTSFDGTESFDGTMTLYAKPPDAWRMDMGTPDGDIVMISNGSATYMCASDGGVGQCFESPIGDTLGIPFLSIFSDPDGFDDLIDTAPGVDVSQSSRNIAGQDATCFSVSGEIDDEVGAAEYCFRDDGVLLLLRAAGSGPDGGDAFTMEAISVSDSVSDEDFEPIYEVLDIGGIFP